MKKIFISLGILIIGIVVWLGVDVVNNESIVKLENKSAVKLKMRDTAALYALQHNQPFDFSELADAYTKMNERHDTADFRTPSLLRILYDHQEKVPADALAEMKSTLLNFKYWMDQPGQDNMCFWSENHQILFSSAEYLLGQLYPDEIFTNTGKTGAEHKEMGRARILSWLEQRWLYGFTEWYSNTYYAEDVAPLVNLIDYADEEVSTKAKIVLDLLLNDIATQSYQGLFVTSSGRMYEGGKREGNGGSMKRLIASIWGDRYNVGVEKSIMQNFLYSEKYQVPEVIKSIGFDESEQIIKATNGLNLSELAGKDLIGQQDNQIMMQLAMEAFTNPEVISNTVAYIDNNDMFSNKFVHDFKIVNLGFVKTFGLLPSISRLLKPVSDGVAIQRANTYTYKTPDFLISTAQAYHPGTFGDQQHLWNALLAKGVSIFTTHPATVGASLNSPSYWVGYGTTPHAVQDENIVLNIYKIPSEAGFMGKKPIHSTHAHFPKDKMDEVIIDGRYAFGRLGHKYVAFTAKNDLYYSKEDNSQDEKEREITYQMFQDGPRSDWIVETNAEYDLIQDGADTYWIFEASTQEKEQSFKEFVERIKSNKVAYINNELSYQSSGKKLALQYQGDFTVNDHIVDTEHKRFDSAYAVVEREAKTMTINHDGKSLFLDFYNQVREER